MKSERKQVKIILAIANANTVARFVVEIISSTRWLLFLLLPHNITQFSNCNTTLPENYRHFGQAKRITREGDQPSVLTL